ncbi:hypothetical protein [Acutalibacter sp. JLR.KK004]
MNYVLADEGVPPVAGDIVLKTYRGGSVTPLDDAISQQTVSS